MKRDVFHSLSPAARRRLRGFTLTELAIVLGVIGVILGAIWIAAAKVYAVNQTKTAATEVATIIGNWQAVFGSKAVDLAAAYDMTQLTVNNNFASAEMVPGTCTVAVGTACTLLGPWSNSTVGIAAGANNSILITYGALTQMACENFANAIMGSAGLIGINIDGVGEVAPPLTKTIVDTDCSMGTGNTVAAEYSMH